LKVKS